MSQSPISNLQSPPGFAPGPLKKLFADRQDRRFWQVEGVKHSYLFWVRAMLTEEVEPPPFDPHPHPRPRFSGEGIEGARARCVAYDFLARAWSYPSAEMLASFAAPQFVTTLADAWTQLAGDVSGVEIIAGLSIVNVEQSRVQESIGRQPSAVSSGQNLDQLREEYTRLFYDTYLPFIPPYESVYYNERQVMGKRALAVMEFYRRVGLTAEGEMPDHIAHECEFVAHLAREQAAARENDASARAAELHVLQAEFLREHLLPWGVKFCADLTKLARGEFYATTARLGNALFNAEWSHSQIVT